MLRKAATAAAAAAAVTNGDVTSTHRHLRSGRFVLQSLAPLRDCCDRRPRAFQVNFYSRRCERRVAIRYLSKYETGYRWRTRHSRDARNRSFIYILFICVYFSSARRQLESSIGVFRNRVSFNIQLCVVEWIAPYPWGEITRLCDMWLYCGGVMFDRCFVVRRNSEAYIQWICGVMSSLYIVIA